MNLAGQSDIAISMSNLTLSRIKQDPPAGAPQISNLKEKHKESEVNFRLIMVWHRLRRKLPEIHERELWNRIRKINPTKDEIQRKERPTSESFQKVWTTLNAETAFNQKTDVLEIRTTGLG